MRTCGMIVGCRGVLELILFAIYQQRHGDLVSFRGGELAYVTVWLLANVLAIVAASSFLYNPNHARLSLLGWGGVQCFYAAYRIGYAVVTWHHRYPQYSVASAGLWDAFSRLSCAKANRSGCR